jgi:hypothetical protein
MSYTKFIGIDPGRSGGISVIDRAELRTYNMPKSIKQMVDILVEEVKRTIEKPEPVDGILVIIERVGMYRSDPAKGGKVFNIAKMIENFSGCKNATELAGLSFKMVEAKKWQGYLRLYDPKESHTQRKNRFKAFAQSVFPDVKITLATSDSTCLAIFGAKGQKNNPEMIAKLPGND